MVVMIIMFKMISILNLGQPRLIGHDQDIDSPEYDTKKDEALPY